MEAIDRWSGTLRAKISSSSYFRVAASLCFSPSSKTLIIPSSNAIFFNGDRVQGTGDPVIGRLSDPRNIAEILVSKLGNFVNAWVVEASDFNGPFAVYKEFIPSMNSRGEPSSYDPRGFPASTSTVSILSKCLEEAKTVIQNGREEPASANMYRVSSAQSHHYPKTTLIGFSKGGTVLNQMLCELAHSRQEPAVSQGEGDDIFPKSKNRLLNSISDIHYVDVGLNKNGAYLTDASVIEKISEQISSHSMDKICFVLHGTPRQWCDRSRPWIRDEKDRLFELLDKEAAKSRGRLQVHERLYFSDSSPNLQMHFQIIEDLDMS